MKNAIILFSGGLDSTTCLASATSQGFNCYALSFHYGQRHSIELEVAAKLTRHYKAEHIVIDLPTAQFSTSALTNSAVVIPDYDGSEKIPVTYVPARNTIFLSFALAWAEILQVLDIFIGVSAIDYSHYPDCRPEYIETFQKLASLATKAGTETDQMRIHAPLIKLSKADTIKLGVSLGVDYRMTLSCYRPNELGAACGSCDSCTLRQKGFREAGIVDPTFYIDK